MRSVERLKWRETCWWTLNSPNPFGGQDVSQLNFTHWVFSPRFLKQNLLEGPPNTNMNLSQSEMLLRVHTLDGSKILKSNWTAWWCLCKKFYRCFYMVVLIIVIPSWWYLISSTVPPKLMSDPGEPSRSCGGHCCTQASRSDVERSATHGAEKNAERWLGKHGEFVQFLFWGSILLIYLHVLFGLDFTYWRMFVFFASLNRR